MPLGSMVILVHCEARSTMSCTELTATTAVSPPRTTFTFIGKGGWPMALRIASTREADNMGCGWRALSPALNME